MKERNKIGGEVVAYCAYIRKSRKDMEAEASGEGETLARHEHALLELAHRMGVDLTEIYREIVSGETIVSRPEMQKLLADVESGKWEGVLVVEVERLARGDTMDQGLVAQTFKYAGTKIITPTKIYDPANEFDEEYFEFGLFMSRREYKTINRRMVNGRIASAKEGKYTGNVPPYGYTRVKLNHEKGYSLEIEPEQAEIVKRIFDWYISGKGPTLIARELNRLGYPPPGIDKWTYATVTRILTNQVYAGKIVLQKDLFQKRTVGGKVQYTYRKNRDPIVAQGRHSPIISERTWHEAQTVRKEKRLPRVNTGMEMLKNPLAGLIVCGECGKIMQRYFTKNSPDMLGCTTDGCKNRASYIYLVEEAVIESLREWLRRIEVSSAANPQDTKSVNLEAKALRKKERELTDTDNQLSKLHDLLERGVYDVDTFLERSALLSRRKKDIATKLVQLKGEIAAREPKIDPRIMAPLIRDVLEIYGTLETAEQKNKLLKTVIRKITYLKHQGGRGHQRDFTLELTLYHPNHL